MQMSKNIKIPIFMFKESLDGLKKNQLFMLNSYLVLNTYLVINSKKSKDRLFCIKDRLFCIT